MPFSDVTESPFHSVFGSPLRGGGGLGDPITATLPEIYISPRDESTITLSGSEVTAVQNKGTITGAFARVGTGPTLSALNGENAFDFTGTQILKFTDAAINAAFGGSGQAWTISFVVKYDLTGTTIPLSINDDTDHTTGSSILFFHVEALGKYRVSKRDAGTAVFGDVTNVTPNLNTHVFTFRHDGTTIDTFLDGVRVETGVSFSTPTDVLDMIMLGAWGWDDPAINNFSGQIGDVVMHASDLSDADVFTIHNELLRVWTDAPTSVDVFLLVGQSNMSGQGTLTGAPDPLDTKYGVDLRIGTRLAQEISEPIDNKLLSTQLGSMVTKFATDYHASSGRFVCVMMRAVNASAIVPAAATTGGDWNPATVGSNYDNHIPDFQTALTAFKAATTKTINSINVIVLQGEREAQDVAGTPALYQAGWEDFATQIVADMTDKPTRFFMIEIGRERDTPVGDPGDAGWAEIRQAQADLATDNAEWYFIDTGFAEAASGLFKDTLHADQALLNTMGAAVASAVLAVIP